MPAGSILPVALCEGKLYFLFGKENPMEDSAKGFSDFGGGIEKGENFYEGALREGSEELKGFLGSKMHLRKRIKRNGGFYPISYQGEKGEYRVHIFRETYDEDLIEHYNDNHNFLWNRMNKTMLNNSRLFEKAEIKWVCETQLRTFMPKMRPFYREIAKLLIEDLPNIRKFIQSRKAKTRKVCFNNRRPTRTRKMVGG